jgi:branched-chain amino acid transport system substrate-binding protein
MEAIMRLGIVALGIVLLSLGGAAHAEISDGKVKIGVLTDMSGPLSDASGTGSVMAAKMAIAEFGGVVDGAPIELLVADHQNKADIGSAIAREWFDQEAVDVIVDIPNSAVALAVQEIARSRSKLLLFSGAGTSDLTGKACSPTSVQWVYDSYEAGKGVAEAMPTLGKTWFFLTADYAFGWTMETILTQFIKDANGTVVGGVRIPFGSTDDSSFVLQAQASKAAVVAVASGATDAITAVMSAKEFGLQDSGQKLVSLGTDIRDIHSMGLATAQGLTFVAPFYPDRDVESRAFTEKFRRLSGIYPGFDHAGVYSSVRHYLASVSAIGSDDPMKVVAKMREMTVNDAFAKGGTIRADGRMVHDVYLVQAKKPSESTGEWDLVRLMSIIPGDHAFRPLADDGCPYLKI